MPQRIPDILPEGRSLEAGAPAPESAGGAGDALDRAELPVGSASVTLTSGRHYEIDAAAGADRVTVRSRAGDIVLRIEVTDQGPVLSFTGASLELSALRRLHLAAAEIAIDAERDLSLSTGGALRERVAGDRHARIAGDDRVEAANVELQASSGAVAVRAMGKIALDGEHIGLNDEPLPRPFGWSEAGEGPDAPDGD